MTLFIKYLKLPFKTKLILIEAYLFLGLASLLIWNMPFKRIAGLLGEENKETACANEHINLKHVYQVSKAIQTMSKYTFWESKCLVQAYTAKFMLTRRKQKTTVYLGVAKDENRKMIAHAWLRCGMVYVTGGNGHKKFTVTAKFA